jgi:hypothetical protein
VIIEFNIDEFENQLFGGAVITAPEPFSTRHLAGNTDRRNMRRIVLSKAFPSGSTHEFTIYEDGTIFRQREDECGCVGPHHFDRRFAQLAEAVDYGRMLRNGGFERLLAPTRRDEGKCWDHSWQW